MDRIDHSTRMPNLINICDSKKKTKKKKGEGGWLMEKKFFEVLVLWHLRLQRCQHWRYCSVPCLKRKLRATLDLRLLVPLQCMLISKDCKKSSTAAEGTIYSNFLMCSRYYQLCLQIFCTVMAVWLLQCLCSHAPHQGMCTYSWGKTVKRTPKSPKTKITP